MVRKNKLSVTPELLFGITAAGWGIAAIYSEVAKTDSTIDIAIRDTYFVIAVFHVYLFFAVVLGFFALFYRFNRRIGRVLGLIHFGMSFFGMMVLFWPYHGLADMPRRYVDYNNWISYNQVGAHQETLVALVVGLLGQVVFVVNVIYSLVRRRKIA